MSAALGTLAAWVAVEGYVADPPVKVLSPGGGVLLLRDGEARVLRLGAVAGELVQSLAKGDLLTGSIALPDDPRLGAVLERLAGFGYLRRQATPVRDELPTVAVVVPAYGRTTMTARCVASLTALDYPPDRLEILVVDDATPDDGAVGHAAVAAGARVVRMGANGGPGAARHAGVVTTDSNLVAFLDTDCVVDRAWLLRLVVELADPAVAAAAARVRTPAGASRVSRFEAARSPLDMGPVFGDLDPRGPRFFLPTANMVVRRSAYEQVGGFTPGLRVGEDVDLCLRLMAAGGRVRYLPEPLVTHEAPRWPRQMAGRRYAYARSESFLWAAHPVTRSGIRQALPRAAVALLVIAVLGPRRRAAAHLTSLAGVAAVAAVASGTRGSGGGDGGGLRPAGARLGRLLANVSKYHAVPLLVAETAVRRSIPVVSAACILGAAVAEFSRARPAVSAIDFVALHALEDVAYSAGLTSGALRRPFLVAGVRRLLNQGPRPPDPTSPMRSTGGRQ